MLARTGDVHGAANDQALYSAFISYSHHDRAAATWLQRRIEGYRLPRHLRRKGAPARLKPVFRDRDELTAAPDLSEAVRDALRRSEHLIVVCTPAAAASAWVGREIDYFREVHGGGVFTALFKGESELAMHAALLHDDHGGTAHPLAADFRSGGDGRRLALLKLIAPLAGVRLDELVQRDAQRRIRQIAAATVAAVVLVITAAALVLTTMRARAAEESALASGVANIKHQLTAVRRELEAAGRLDLLEALNRGIARYFAGRNPATLTVSEVLARAALLQAEGKDDEQRGDLPAARRNIVESWRLTTPLLVAYPDDPKIIYAHAQSEFFMGYIDWRLGDARHAHHRFTRYAVLADKLSGIDPRNAEWRRERANAATTLGALTLRQAFDAAGARRYFQAAQDDLAVAARISPRDADIQAELADGEAWLADTARVANNLTAAHLHRSRQRALIVAQINRFPRDARLRTSLVSSELGLARIEAARSSYVAALDHFDTAQREVNILAATDPENKSVARQLRAIEVFKVHTWLGMPSKMQPSTTVISSALGDCNAEWSKARNQELAALCSLAEARLAFLEGNHTHGSRLLAHLSILPLLRTPGLTERWRVDLHAC